MDMRPRMFGHELNDRTADSERRMDFIMDDLGGNVVAGKFKVAARNRSVDVDHVDFRLVGKFGAIEVLRPKTPPGVFCDRYSGCSSGTIIRAGTFVRSCHFAKQKLINVCIKGSEAPNLWQERHTRYVRGNLAIIAAPSYIILADTKVHKVFNSANKFASFFDKFSLCKAVERCCTFACKRSRCGTGTIIPCIDAFDLVWHLFVKSLVSI